jgi:hypothetical protein
MKTLIRFAEDADLPFVYNSWLKSHRAIFNHENMDGSPFSPSDLELRTKMRDRHDQTKFMKNVSYFSSYKRHVTRLIDESHTILAVDQSKPELIYAYAVFQHYAAGSLVVHFAYTKHANRKLGLQKKLLTEAAGGNTPNTVFVTIHNLSVSDLRARFPEQIVYDPYILEG